MASKTPLGAFLARLRARTKTTQVRVAEALGVTRLTVLGWENGSIRIYADHLGRFLEAVGATPDERAHATRLAADPDGIPAETPPDDDFHLDLDDVPHTPHGFPESFDGEVLVTPAPDEAILTRPPAAPAPPPPPTLVPPPSLTTSAPNVWSLVVGSCSRTSCGGDVVPVQDDELPRAWNQTRCQECGLERLEPRLRSVDDIPAMAEAETARRARGAA